jgi:imidazolonepropionase-like amidohydrolase
MIAVVGGTVLDGNGQAPIENGVILIDEKRIGAVGDGTIPIPPRAQKIYVTGKFVIPALMCPSVFLVEGTWPPEMIRCEGRYDEVAIEAAQLALKAGVTTVFDTWGPRDPLIKARQAINEGRATGARIYLGGNWIGIGGPYSADMRQHFKEAVGEPFAARTNALWEVNVGERLTRLPLEEVRQEVRKYVRSGIDFVIYPVNAHRYGATDCFALSPRVQRMIVEEAREAGLPVLATFVTTEEGIHSALDAGADIAALFPWSGKPTPAETLSLIADRGIFAYFSPSTADELERYRRQPNLSPGWLELHETADLDHRGLIRARARLIGSRSGEMHSADQRIVWTKLLPGARPLGQGYVGALQALQEKGMTAMEALMTQTRNIAEAYKVDKDLGTLEPGKFADLVVLNNNPLESPQNHLNIHLVMKEGKVIDRNALPSRRLWTASAVASN